MATATKSRKGKHVSTKPPTDIYKVVTDNIIRALESADGNWKQPWRAIASGPRNIYSREQYHGINVLQLAFTQFEKGYASPWWGTYKQWTDKGGQVRKGEKSTYSVFYKSYSKEVRGDDGEVRTEGRRVARANPLFNIAQVDGVAIPVTEAPRIVGERLVEADAWIAATGAAITYGGNRAYYTPSVDRIACPAFEAFDTPPAFYSTIAHELTHWTADAKRCDRTFGKRFGDEQYAVEELVAELGSAFSCARLGIESEPREDHVQYLKNWIKVLRADDHAVFTAAAAAQRACDFLFDKEVAA